MGNSLQEQLMQAGLVSAQQLKQTKSNKRKQRRQGGDQDGQARKEALTQAAAEKSARDRELNRLREQEAKARAEQAALRELIHQQRVPRADGDRAYNFADGSALKRLYVSGEQQAAIVAGRLAIVRQDNFYELIPAETAARLAERAPERILVWNQKDETPAADDPYAEFQVPDDLIW